MLPEVKMDMVKERYQYLRRMKKRYQKANRQERSRLLDEEEWFYCSEPFRLRPIGYGSSNPSSEPNLSKGLGLLQFLPAG